MSGPPPCLAYHASLPMPLDEDELQNNVAPPHQEEPVKVA